MVDNTIYYNWNSLKEQNLNVLTEKRKRRKIFKVTNVSIRWEEPFTRIYAAAAKSLQSYLTVQPHRWQPTRLPVPGILQARTLEWVAISFSNGWKWKVKVKSLSHVRLLVTPWTAAYQAPPSMGFSRQEYWSGLPLPSLSYNFICQL